MRWSLLILFPVGWFVSYDLLTDQHVYYVLLTLVALAATFVILSVLGRRIKREVHLWVIFILYLIGYFLKFYLLCYMKVHSQDYGGYLQGSYPLETELLNSTELIISYYETVTVVLVAFAILVTVLMRGGRRTASTVRAPFVGGGGEVRIKVQRRTIKRLLVVGITVSILLLYVQIKLGLGLVSAAERQTTQLPYHLAGIIMTVSNGLLPLLFLLTVWLADSIRAASLARLTITAYILFGVASGLLSTSKAALVSVMVSLVILWLLTGNFTQKRGRLLAALALFMVVFNVYLGINRTLRNIYPDMGVFDIAAMAISYLLTLHGGILTNAESLPLIANYAGPLLRINGADSLLNIINYAPSFSFDRIWFILFESPDTVASLFTTDVLGLPPQLGLGFSPSLLGYLLFVFGNVSLVCFGMIVYTLAWHMIFRTIMNARLIIEPILIALLIVTLGQFTSEGTLESMPQTIAIVVAFGVIGEFFLRRSFGRGIRQTIYPSSSRPSL